MKLNLAKELAALEQMTVGQLPQRYAEVFGESVRSRHKHYLIRRIAWRLQAHAEGGLSERALRRAEELAKVADVRVTPPRGAGSANQVAPAARSDATSRASDPRLPPVGAAIATRCAIYTRKSSDEGLQQEFNSLDAQREAAEACIASQKNEGWACLPDRYDDGGFMRGNMERPGLQRLLSDIGALIRIRRSALRHTETHDDGEPSAGTVIQFVPFTTKRAEAHVTS
jgi:hypothetical protein